MINFVALFSLSIYAVLFGVINLRTDVKQSLFVSSKTRCNRFYSRNGGKERRNTGTGGDATGMRDVNRQQQQQQYVLQQQQQQQLKKS